MAMPLCSKSVTDLQGGPKTAHGFHCNNFVYSRPIFIFHNFWHNIHCWKFPTGGFHLTLFMFKTKIKTKTCVCPLLHGPPYNMLKYDVYLIYYHTILCTLCRGQRVAGLRENSFQHDRKVRNLRRIRHRLLVHAGIVSNHH